jgi:hypothetical protein
LPCDPDRMHVVHMGLWKVKPDADPAVLKRAAEKVERVKQTVPGCTEALLAPLYVPEMGRADHETFGNLDSFGKMARGYNHILSPSGRARRSARVTKSTRPTWICATTTSALRCGSEMRPSRRSFSISASRVGRQLVPRRRFSALSSRTPGGR